MRNNKAQTFSASLRRSIIPIAALLASLSTSPRLYTSALFSNAPGSSRSNGVGSVIGAIVRAEFEIEDTRLRIQSANAIGCNNDSG